jgi:hypothetical protein
MATDPAAKQYETKRRNLVFILALGISLILFTVSSGDILSLFNPDLWSTLIPIGILLYPGAYIATKGSKPQINKVWQAVDLIGRVIGTYIITGILVYGLIFLFCAFCAGSGW